MTSKSHWHNGNGCRLDSLNIINVSLTSSTHSFHDISFNSPLLSLCLQIYNCKKLTSIRSSSLLSSSNSLQSSQSHWWKFIGIDRRSIKKEKPSKDPTAEISLLVSPSGILRLVRDFYYFCGFAFNRLWELKRGSDRISGTWPSVLIISEKRWFTFWFIGKLINKANYYFKFLTKKIGEWSTQVWKQLRVAKIYQKFQQVSFGVYNNRL